MDVRCEKCQTEYELDEARLKPGGVTVKCTNCGHMFKIRKRPSTNVGAAAPNADRAPPQASRPPPTARAESILDEAPRLTEEGPTAVDRQWLIRLENGEQRSCRELATLQQWIVSCVVSRESLISRTGKTWKRLGDIAELAQYFDIADEARTTRAANPTPAVGPFRKQDETARGTMLGLGAPATAAGGTILPDDDDMDRTTGSFSSQPGPRRPTTQPPPPPGKVPTRTPPMGSNSASAPAATSAPEMPVRRPPTQPPPPPPKKPTGPVPQVAPQAPKPSIPIPTGNRATAAWASEGAGSLGSDQSTGNTQSGPFVGKISGIPDEPAFAGRVRVSPQDEASFDTGRVRMPEHDDDDELLPKRRGSSTGIVILLMVLLVGGGAAAAVYFLVIKQPAEQVAASADAMVVAQLDAAPIVTPVIDAPEAPPLSPVETARGELAADTEARLTTALATLGGNDEPDALTVRAHLGVAIAQALIDRAGLTADKAETTKLRKEAKAIVIEAATAAQKAHKAAPDDPGPNLALAHVLRLQGKQARDVRRYIDAARARPGDWIREVALAEALLFARDGKLDEAKTLFGAVDSGDGKLETSNDVRARYHLALIALAQNKPGDAKPLVEQVLAAQSEHVGARALAAKLDTTVVKTDPLPPEDPKQGSGSAVVVNPGSGSGGKPPPPPAPDGVGGGDYDSYLKRANALADTNCTKANELYLKALEKKPNGVEALTGLGYCALDAKNFQTAHSRFRTALATSPKYEPALAGIAEGYQQQGRKDDAIAAWRRYLEAFPNAKKGTLALERLGASPDGGTPNNGTPGPGSSEAPPPPSPPPEGAGSG